MDSTAKEGSLSARGGTVVRRTMAANGGPAQNAGSANFLKLVERTTDAFVTRDDTAVEDVRRILLDVRQQYDTVHHASEKKEEALKDLRESIRQADSCHYQKSEEMHKLEEDQISFERQLREADAKIMETKTCRKVYEHMLARIQKEQAILKQKMLRMEEHMARKKREVSQKIRDNERMDLDKTMSLQTHDALERDADHERGMCRQAQEVMEGELERRKEANKRRADFESWRHEVALEAANEAFNASAGKLRKLYAVEKLQGNCLQKITYEQVERSQNTEDGFQKIREVTGLADVMDIVHKFLNREVEHEQLHGSVKDAEVRLEALQQSYEDLKQKTEGITFDASAAGRSGDIYKHIEDHDQELNDALKEHELCRGRLQKTTLQVEHMKRWTGRVGLLLSTYEESLKNGVEGAGELPSFFNKLGMALEKFVVHVTQQIREGKVQRKALAQVQTREYNEQAKLLNSEQFLHANCRVPATADGRPASRQGASEDDPQTWFSDERKKWKDESMEKQKKSADGDRQKKVKGK